MTMKEINNSIEESYCSYEVSKLFKEKGFNASIRRYYTVNSHKFVHSIAPETNNGERIIIPTHTLAIEWIRVNFDYYVEIKTPDLKDGKWLGEVHKVHGFGNYFDSDGFDSPQEAIEAALLYVLNNLI